MFYRSYVSGLGCNLNVRCCLGRQVETLRTAYGHRIGYQNVHRSTGFAPYRPKSEPFPTELEALFAVCSEYYEVLCKDAIHA